MKIKILIYFLIIILFLSCNKKANYNIEQNNILEKDIIDNSMVNYPIEEKYYSIYRLKTNILENNTDARVYPSFDTEIILKLKKDDIVTIRGFSNDGLWVCVTYPESKIDHAWVYSEKINIGNVAIAPLTFINQDGNKTTFSYDLKGEKVIAEYTDWNNDDLIVWGSHEENYHYSNVPGIYIVNKDAQELIHITHFGAVDSEGANAWTRFLNDYTYLLQDIGTSVGIRGLRVWNVRDKKIAFQGTYYKNSIINNHTIQYVVEYDDWNIKNGNIDEEIALYAKTFMENNPAPEREHGGLFVTLIIKCSLDLETNKRNILGAEYIFTQ